MGKKKKKQDKRVSSTETPLDTAAPSSEPLLVRTEEEVRALIYAFCARH